MTLSHRWRHLGLCMKQTMWSQHCHHMVSERIFVSERVFVIVRCLLILYIITGNMRYILLLHMQLWPDYSPPHTFPFLVTSSLSPLSQWVWFVLSSKVMFYHQHMKRYVSNYSLALSSSFSVSVAIWHMAVTQIDVANLISVYFSMHKCHIVEIWGLILSQVVKSNDFSNTISIYMHIIIYIHVHCMCYTLQYWLACDWCM